MRSQWLTSAIRALYPELIELLDAKISQAEEHDDD